jgi:transcriptional repressor NrdR
MECPKCKNADTKVVDSRSVEDGRAIRRRRRCEKCDYRFTTFERLELSDLIVKKSDGTGEPYSREKLERGIWLACGKRPVTPADVDALLSDCEEKWFGKKEITSHEIGEDVIEHLRGLDEIAYIRFASVYRDFRDINDFQKAIGE